MVFNFLRPKKPQAVIAIEAIGSVLKVHWAALNALADVVRLSSDVPEEVKSQLDRLRNGGIPIEQTAAIVEEISRLARTKE